MNDAPDLTRGRRRTSGSGTERLPPHNVEAEQSAIGCILMDETRSVECVSLMIEKLGRNAEEAFFDLRHKTIWTAIAELVNAGVKLYIVTLANYLKDKQLLEQVGGITYLSTLADCAPSPAALGTFIDILLEKLRRRKMIATCVDAVAKLYEDPETDTTLDTVERDIMDVRQIGQEHQVRPVSEVVKDAICKIEDYHQRKGMLIGLGTGFHDLDKMTGGLVGGGYYILAARPSMGKTSLAMNIAEHVAIDLQEPVGVFSLEMSIDSLVMRMLCSRARVNLRNVTEGFLAERDFPKLTGSAGKIAKANLFVDDASGLSIMELRARARRMKIQKDIKLLIIDYIQLLIAMVNGRRPDKREREVSEVSSGLKALAKELQIPILAVSQLNREIDRSKRRPVMADLRESGSLEQDADFIGMLYKPDKGEEDRGDYQAEEATAVNLAIEKQRNGPTGDVHLTFLRSYTRFESAAKVGDNDVPEQDTLDYRRYPT